MKVRHVHTGEEREIEKVTEEGDYIFKGDARAHNPGVWERVSKSTRSYSKRTAGQDSAGRVHSKDGSPSDEGTDSEGKAGGDEADDGGAGAADDGGVDSNLHQGDSV